MYNIIIQAKRSSRANSTSDIFVVWSLERIQQNCLSVRSGSLNGHLRTDFFRNGYAHVARFRSEPSRRRSSWPKPHLFGCPVCGVIRVDFQHPNRGDGSSGSNRSAKASGKTVRHVYFLVKNWVKSVLYSVLQAIGGTATAKAVLRPCLLAASLRPSLAPSPFLPPPLPPSATPSHPPSPCRRP